MQTSKQILPAVAAAIFNDRGEVLLQKRMDVDQWCIISGHIEFGETVEDAILREIKEETNVPAKILRFIGVYSSPGSQTYYYTNKTVQYVTSYFEAQLTGTIDTFYNNNETQELRFFHPNRLPINMATINPFWLEDALSKDNAVFLR